MTLFILVYALAPIIAASSDSSEIAAAPLILVLAGVIFYATIYARYRNADKRHSHETETSTTVANLLMRDNYLRHMKRLSYARMRGANHQQIEGAQNVSGGSADVLRQLGVENLTKTLRTRRGVLPR